MTRERESWQGARPIGGAMDPVHGADAGIDARRETSHFYPEDYVLHHIQRAVANRQTIEIALDGDGTLKVFGGEGTFTADIYDMATFCTLPASYFRVEVVSVDDRGGGRHDVAELLWQAAYHASQGRLVRGCYHYDVVELVRWPNVTRLPGGEQAIRLAALLSRHPTSILFASRVLDIDAPDIYRLYSAAHCAGLTRLLNREPEPPALRPHAKRGVFGLILQRLAGR